MLWNSIVSFSVNIVIKSYSWSNFTSQITKGLMYMKTDTEYISKIIAKFIAQLHSLYITQEIAIHTAGLYSLG